MPRLEVPGADLHYEIAGSGPMVLCISGANGSFEAWQPLTLKLMSQFTVVSYDRRGYSRSGLVGAQDYEHRMDVDADDAAALIKALSPNGKAIVLGNSSGALVALKTLLRHPDSISLLIPHEPPALNWVPETAELKKKTDGIYNTYRKYGIRPGLEAFAGPDFGNMGAEASGFIQAFDPAGNPNPYAFPNAMYWFEREFNYGFEAFPFDDFRQHKQKLMPINGELSKSEVPHKRANQNLGKELGMDVPDLPGAHLGFLSHAPEFAEALLALLRKRDLVPEQI